MNSLPLDHQESPQTSFCVDVSVTYHGSIARSGIAGSCDNCVHPFEKLPDCLPKWLHHCNIHQQRMRVPVFPLKCCFDRFPLWAWTLHSVNTQDNRAQNISQHNPIIITIITTLYCHHNIIMGSITSLEF